MRTVGLTIGGSRLAAALAAVFIALTLAACGGTRAPFGKTAGISGPPGKTVPPIALVALEGMPPGRAPAFKETIAASAGNRDMAIVEDILDAETLTLKGRFTVTPGAAATRVVHSWTLADRKGAALHNFSAEEQAPAAAGGNAWGSVTPAVLQRVADAATVSLAQKLKDLGYATEAGTARAPEPAWRLATAQQGRTVDRETLVGPGADWPDGSVGPAESETPEMTASIEKPAPPAAAAPDAKSGKVREIRAVAVLPVTGAPGKGNEELTGAMREILKGAGWPVVEAPRPDALTIRGTVSVAPPEAKKQMATLAWAVSTPDGKLLGTVKQANSVAAGSLDKGFGDTARPAVEAAATGIFDIVKKLR